MSEIYRFILGFTLCQIQTLGRRIHCMNHASNFVFINESKNSTPPIGNDMGKLQNVKTWELNRSMNLQGWLYWLYYFNFLRKLVERIKVYHPMFRAAVNGR